MDDRKTFGAERLVILGGGRPGLKRFWSSILDGYETIGLALGLAVAYGSWMVSA
jgi:hypothetical protein